LKLCCGVPDVSTGVGWCKVPTEATPHSAGGLEAGQHPTLSTLYEASTDNISGKLRKSFRHSL
jgi:hypothetical protein